MERFLDRYFDDPTTTDYWQSAQPRLPTTEEDDEGLVNLDASHPELLPMEAGGEDIPVEPPDPLGASSSRHGDVGDPGWEAPVEDLDAYTLHAQHEALERAKREWQQAREALIDDRVHQWIQLRHEFNRERETLYLQLQKDHEQQERDLLQAAEQSKQELLREVQQFRTLQLWRPKHSAAQQAERIQLQREWDALEKQCAALHKEQEMIDMEAQERVAAADLQRELTIQAALKPGRRSSRDGWARRVLQSDRTLTDPRRNWPPSSRVMDGVGTFCRVGTVERIRLTSFLARSQEPVRRADREMDKQLWAYAALQQWTSELSHERDQLRTDFSNLQHQVLLLMADRDRERPSQAESLMADYVTDDLTMASSPPARRATGSMTHDSAGSGANQLPHRSFRVTFNEDPDELAFFLIQAGSYMEVHGAGFRTDRE
uniref:Uncharacterized protein n=1 Tax=Sphaerodactylus townsendi TaxID=933632 RepID=A0ACB8F7V5_9SAUR